MGLTPVLSEGVSVGGTDTAVCDLDVDVGLPPLLGLKGTPLHGALSGLWAVAKPSFECVRHGDDVCSVILELR